MKISAMLPFLGRKEIDKLIDEILQGKMTKISVTRLLPFASQSKVDALFLHSYRTEQKLHKEFLPFVSQACLHELVIDYIDKNDNHEFPTCALPFLNSEDVKALFYYQLERQNDPDFEQEDSKGFHYHSSCEGKDVHIDLDFDDEDEDEDVDEDNDED